MLTKELGLSRLAGSVETLNEDQLSAHRVEEKKEEEKEGRKREGREKGREKEKTKGKRKGKRKEGNQTNKELSMRR